ncbi:MAG: 2-C-methyl-D-erythritol 2,4-cyclodiphosphate synthase [Candidatus Omnitrophica bacterium]|nr:2-C-methyl-D-erythritol 2,4-cyclodiphosphate synthase [Candidatus Omnitrophota bacterium]
MKVCAIVPAAGGGVRLFPARSKIPPRESKVFISVGGIPILARSLIELSRVKSIDRIIVALKVPVKAHFIRNIKKRFGLKKVSCVVSGGRTRAESVRLAFAKVPRAYTHVLIHDGVRPFIRPEAIERLLREVKSADGAILAKPVTPTIKCVGPANKILHTVDRARLWEAETPQVFKRSALERAFCMFGAKELGATDEASLVEAIGGDVRVVEDPFYNPKITTPVDLDLAERYASSTAGPPRVGIGFDIHRLVKGRPLYLGGVRIPSRLGALGHSDADTLLHAISDGILGSLSLGDIGEHFSDTDPRYRGIRSTKLLKKVLSQLRDSGFRVVNVDSNIMLERPKLGKYKKIIQKKVARLLGIPPRSVSIKAKTYEGLGIVGSGQAVACQVLVQLGK